MSASQDLAHRYLKKIASMLDEFMKIERETPLEQRVEVYAHNQTRLQRVLRNYDNKLDPDTEATEERILEAHNATV